jgi:hypothetical protein
MSYFGATDLIFNNDPIEGIHTGGFSVKNIMMKGGISPIVTINNEQHGGSNQVSDLFNSDLVVPNWTYTYNPDIKIGGKKKQNFDSDDEEVEVIDDELHDKLLELVKVHESEMKKKFKKTKKNMEKLKKMNKKGSTTKRNK